MQEERGIGIAAPQVGISQQIVIVGNPGLVMINPKIIAKGKDVAFSPEACLSCPGLEVDVLRFTKVTIEFQRIGGTKTKQDFEGFTAFVAQHELEHLLGVTLEDHKNGNIA